MSLSLKNKVCLVTGGTRGIGRGIVETLAQHGADVAFTYTSSSDIAEKIKQELESDGTNVLTFQADAQNTERAAEVIKNVTDTWGKIDVLVNNAGITKDNLLLRMKEADWDDVMNVNVKSVFNYTKAVTKSMMRNRGGSIINISSVIGVSGNAGQSNYAASKAGIIGFSKSVAKELASRNIRTNVIAPGYIDTDMTGELDEEFLKQINEQIPLNRPGTVEEVAKAVLFLASDHSSYINGHVLHVDGGMNM